VVIALIVVVAMCPKVRGPDVQLNITDANEAIRHSYASMAKLRTCAAAAKPRMDHVNAKALQRNERFSREPLTAPKPRQDGL